MNKSLLTAIDNGAFSEAIELAAYKAMPFFTTFLPGWAAIEKPTVTSITKKLDSLLRSCAESISEDDQYVTIMSGFLEVSLSLRSGNKNDWNIQCDLVLSERFVTVESDDPIGLLLPVDPFDFD